MERARVEDAGEVAFGEVEDGHEECGCGGDEEGGEGGGGVVVCCKGDGDRCDPFDPVCICMCVRWRWVSRIV